MLLTRLMCYPNCRYSLFLELKGKETELKEAYLETPAGHCIITYCTYSLFLDLRGGRRIELKEAYRETPAGLASLPVRSVSWTTKLQKHVYAQPYRHVLDSRGIAYLGSTRRLGISAGQANVDGLPSGGGGWLSCPICRSRSCIRRAVTSGTM